MREMKKTEIPVREGGIMKIYKELESVGHIITKAETTELNKAEISFAAGCSEKKNFCRV